MAGVDCPNIPTKVQGAARSVEVPDADWVGGVNVGASNGNYIGVATGVQNPFSSFGTLAQNPPQVVTLPGHDPDAPSPETVVAVLSNGEEWTVGYGFVEAAGGAAPEARYNTNLLTNKTCVHLDQFDFAWGIGAIIP